MKIAVLSSHTPSLFWFRMDMMKTFVSLGHEVVAIADEAEEVWRDEFAQMGIKYRSAYISRTGTNPLCDIKTFFSLRKILKEEEPDKIFTYQAKTVIYGSLAAKTLGITEIYPLIAGIGSVFLSSGAKAKLLYFILKTEYRAALKKCKTVFFQNPDDVEVFSKMKAIKKENAFLLNGSGVNLNIFAPLSHPDGCHFLCISRLIKDKGVREYLEAAKVVKQQHPECRFLLVGPFDSNPSALTPEELELFTKNGTVEYFGEQTDVRPYLAQCNVFVLPSYREGTPKTVLEAMATSRAIITTNAPGCRETVTDGENGFLVPTKDVTSLAKKMEIFINDPSLAPQMGKKGRIIVEEKFDVIKVNEAIVTAMKI